MVAARGTAQHARFVKDELLVIDRTYELLKWFLGRPATAAGTQTSLFDELTGWENLYRAARKMRPTRPVWG
jgi:hypothetical protein